MKHHPIYCDPECANGDSSTRECMAYSDGYAIGVRDHMGADDLAEAVIAVEYERGKAERQAEIDSLKAQLVAAEKESRETLDTKERTWEIIELRRIAEIRKLQLEVVGLTTQVVEASGQIVVAVEALEEYRDLALDLGRPTIVAADALAKLEAIKKGGV